MSFLCLQFSQKTIWIEVPYKAVHKLHLQEDVGRVGGQKNQLFVNFYTIENVNGGGSTLWW